MLKLSYPKLAASAVFLGLCVMPAKADILLGTAFFPIEFISSTVVLNQAQFTATDGFGTDASVTILSDSPFYSSGDAPASITLLVGAGGTAAANAFANLLTNGVNDVIELRVKLGNTSNADSGGTFTDVSEKVRFSLASNDFQDSTISKIVFNVTSLTFTPFEAGTRARFDANIQIFAIAPVPEPGMLLSGMAMITMTAFSRPRRRRAV